MNFLKNNSLGHPYHGLVTSNVLTLSNSKQISYPGITNGDTQLVSVPNYPVITRTPEQQNSDRQQGFEWHNQAIVTDNHLGDVNLGNDWLLYIDDNKVVWYLKLGYEVSGNQCFMSCTLQSVFGRFGKKYSTVTRLLTQAKTSLMITGIIKPLNRFTFERKSDGSEVLIHIYARLDGSNAITFPEEMSLCEIWILELQGNGVFVENNSLGLGITAKLSLFKSLLDIQSSTTRSIKRVDSRFRVGKVNMKDEYDPKPAKPPACQSNTLRSSYSLALVPEGENFVPFDFDKNLYVQSNWYGQEEVKTDLVRMLYNGDGKIHALAIQIETKKLNHVYQSAEGSGTSIRGPFHYEFKWNTCIMTGPLPPISEEYQWNQHSESQFNIVKSATLLLDGVSIDTFSLSGKCEQTANTSYGQNVVNAVNILVKMNEQVLREISGTPEQFKNSFLTDPFSSTHPADDKNGVYANIYFGFLSNNLLGLFVERYVASDIKNVTQKVSHVVLGVETINMDLKVDALQFYLKGSFNPITKQMTRYREGEQGWV